MTHTPEGVYPKHFEDIQYSSEANAFNDDIATNTAASHAESHTIVSHSDTTATGTELNTLTGGGETTLHSHAGGGAGTAYWSISGGGFMPERENDQFDRELDGTYDTQDIQYMFAPVHLPDGVRITSVIVYGDDTNVTWRLDYRTPSATSGSFYIADGTLNSSDSLGHVISNQTRAYYLTIVAAPDNTTIRGAVITYTL